MVEAMKEINKILQDARADIRRERKVLLENLQACKADMKEDIKPS
jgi:F0F1-type ATP synthase membrane subunit b/b'